ncbi:glutathione S-transferase [Gammaproteobacteria bacterium]|nr:glutathione S-transferase [Gammaproteobacteria bacterium]
MTVTLYGSPVSLYTGKVRSYLIKAGISFREEPPVTDHYEDVVLEKAGGRRSMPTVELSDGQVIRDSAAILSHFEAETGSPFTPVTPKQKAISLLFNVIGAEGLSRPAVHYRWRFPENLPLVLSHFEEITPKNGPPQFTVAGRIEQMEQGLLRLGISEDRIELVEGLYLRLLNKLNAHFERYPYLLGGKPSIGDFSLMGPMYSHLARDIKPLTLMHEHGVHVLRWTERMNRPDPGFSTAHAPEEDFLSNDEIPETLLEILRHFAIDFVPETRAACDVVNEWIGAHLEVVEGTKVERFLDGPAVFDIEGTRMSSIVMPFRFYQLKRLQDEVAASSASVREEVIQLLASVNMKELLGMTLTRDIGRAHNLEVWQ